GGTERAVSCRWTKGGAAEADRKTVRNTERFVLRAKAVRDLRKPGGAGRSRAEPGGERPGARSGRRRGPGFRKADDAGRFAKRKKGSEFASLALSHQDSNLE